MSKDSSEKDVGNRSAELAIKSAFGDKVQIRKDIAYVSNPEDAKTVTKIIHAFSNQDLRYTVCASLN